jgi:hypothetical protein
MKLSAETRAILKNYSQINKHLLIKAGNVLLTKATDKTIAARAVVPEVFPVDVPLYDLPDLLNVLNLYQDADIEFGKHGMVISELSSSTTYGYANPDILDKFTNPPGELPQEFVFTVSKDTLKNLKDAIQTLNNEHVVLICEDGKFWIECRTIASIASVKGRNDRIHTIAFPDENPASDFFIPVDAAAFLKVLMIDYRMGIYRGDHICVTLFSDTLTYWLGAHSESRG